MQELSYVINTSEGASVGYNNDSTTGGEIWYTWYADTERAFLFHDMADQRSTEDATNIHGLFGAIIVEALGIEWWALSILIAFHSLFLFYIHLTGGSPQWSTVTCKRDVLLVAVPFCGKMF